MAANPRVEIFAPYYRERVMIARDLAKVPRLESLDDIKGQRIAVPGQTLAGWLLIGADSGKYREQLTTKLKDGIEAARLLQTGEVAAAAAQASELEAVLAGDARFAIEPLPLPRMREGWVVGCAVKKESTDLAQAVQAAMNQVAESGEMARIFERAKVSWRKP
jgi:ABC-type amino acid transport substrate-binding protein